MFRAISVFLFLTSLALFFCLVGSTGSTPHAAARSTVVALSRPSTTGVLSAQVGTETAPSGGQGETSFCRDATIMSENDPAEAVQLVLENVRSSRLRSDSLIDIFDDWALRGPADAARCAESLPVGADRTAAIYVVADRWIKANPTSAYIWMKSLPEFDALQLVMFDQSPY